MVILENPATPVPYTGRKAAIVTLIIGKNYIATWLRLCRASWHAYAERCGMDLIVIAAPLDTSARATARSPAWQKLLILSQPWSQQYERIIWLDSDIVIAPHAPDIIEYAGPAEKISLAISGGRSSTAERMVFMERLYNTTFRPDAEREVWNMEVHKNYTSHKIPEHDVMYNTGVLVLSPLHHRELFLQCYEGEDSGGRLYEQPLLSHEIVERNLAHVINIRFNWGIQEALFLYVPEIITLHQQAEPLRAPAMKMAHFLVRCELRNAYFLHFYGTMGLMMTMNPQDIFGGAPLDLYLDKPAS